MHLTSDIGGKERFALYVQLHFIIQTWQLNERMISIVYGDGSFNNIVIVKKLAKCSNFAIFRLDFFRLVLTFEVASANLLACLQFMYGLYVGIGGGLCVTK